MAWRWGRIVTSRPLRSSPNSSHHCSSSGVSGQPRICFTTEVGAAASTATEGSASPVSRRLRRTSRSRACSSGPHVVHSVAATLKCPVCHDLSAPDSPVAQQMRAQISDELRAGRAPDQIRTDFVAAYGEWILLSPPQRGLGLAGLALLAVTLPRWSRKLGVTERCRRARAERRRPAAAPQGSGGARGEVE